MLSQTVLLFVFRFVIFVCSFWKINKRQDEPARTCCVLVYLNRRQPWQIDCFCGVKSAIFEFPVINQPRRRLPVVPHILLMNPNKPRKRWNWNKHDVLGLLKHSCTKTRSHENTGKNRLQKYGFQSETTIDSCLWLETIPGQNIEHKTECLPTYYTLS
jgi:hypothetical protein